MFCCMILVFQVNLIKNVLLYDIGFPSLPVPPLSTPPPPPASHNFLVYDVYWCALSSTCRLLRNAVCISNLASPPPPPPPPPIPLPLPQPSERFQTSGMLVMSLACYRLLRSMPSTTSCRSRGQPTGRGPSSAHSTCLPSTGPCPPPWTGATRATSPLSKTRDSVAPAGPSPL